MEYSGRHSVSIFILMAVIGICRADPVLEKYSSNSANCPVTEAVLPPWLGAGFHVASTEHFYVAHDAGEGDCLLLADQLEAAYQHFYRFFGQYGFNLDAPQTPLGWISFSHPVRFSRYARRADQMDLSRLGGYYSARTNCVAIVRAPDRHVADVTEAAFETPENTSISAMGTESSQNVSIKIAHELAHQLAFNTGLQKRGVMYPLWVSEGLATQYETQLSYCRNTNQARQSRLCEMLAHDRLIPLDELIVLTRLPATQSMCEDVYAQSWGFFHFLLMRYPDTLKNYLDALYFQKPGRRPVSSLRAEFLAHFGEGDTLSREWIRYIQHTFH